MSRSQPFRANPGVSLPAIAMSGGLIYGIEIDNSSGSWLYIPTLETYVAPYRIGWSMDVPYGATSIDVLATDGPAGQLSTSQGSAITVYLSGERVGYSEGVTDPRAGSAGSAVSPDSGAPFIEGFTPVLTDSQIFSVSFATGLLTTLLAPIAGKRYRVHTLTVSLKPSGGNPAEAFDGGCLFAYHDTTTFAVRATGRLHPIGKPSDTQLFPDGLDFPIGLGIAIQAIADFVFVQISASTTYSVI